MTTTLKASNLNKKFTSNTRSLMILSGLNLNVAEGESIAIVGVSGSGKTTLLSLLAGLDIPDKGSIEIDGIDITKLSEAERSQLRAAKMSFVFQDFMLLPHLTALENVMLPLEMQGRHNPRAIALQELKKVGLGPRAGHFPAQLSGGEQQRTALARAFAVKPLLLFADEPNGNLDAVTGEQIQKLLFGMNRESKTTLILVTHDMKLAHKCDKLYELNKGKLRLRSNTKKAR